MMKAVLLFLLRAMGVLVSGLQGVKVWHFARSCVIAVKMARNVGVLRLKLDMTCLYGSERLAVAIMIHVQDHTPHSMLSVYLIKRPGVREATIPDLIHYPRGVNIIFTAWSIQDRKGCPSPYALLMLLRKFPLSSCNKFAHESTLAAQRRRSDFCTSSMSEVVLPVDPEA